MARHYDSQAVIDHMEAGRGMTRMSREEFIERMVRNLLEQATADEIRSALDKIQTEEERH